MTQIDRLNYLIEYLLREDNPHAKQATPQDALKQSRRELSEKKKALYAEYRAAQAEMRETVAVKANIDHLLGR